MSAYVVDKVHIDVMVRAGLNVRYKPMGWYHGGKHHKLTYENADQVGQMLIDECVRSVGDRYGNDKVTELPGPNNAYWLIPYKYEDRPMIPDAVTMLKVIGCYEYQSCECEDWQQSEAWAFCDSLKGAQYNRLPGWDDATRDWMAEDDNKLNGNMVSLMKRVL